VTRSGGLNGVVSRRYHFQQAIEGDDVNMVKAAEVEQMRVSRGDDISGAAEGRRQNCIIRGISDDRSSNLDRGHDLNQFAISADQCGDRCARPLDSSMELASRQDAGQFIK
jgi:hypothetical protein